MFYTSAEVLPREDKVAQRLGEISDILFRHSRKDFNLRVGEREIRYTDSPRFVVVVDQPRTIRRLLLRPNQYAAAEAFVDRHFDIEGNLIEGLRTKNALAERAATLRTGEKLKLLTHLFLI
jgi:cyclopropane-fatty-acyl-phospholipid synthase